MVLDTSAVLAVLQNEPERDAFIDRIAKTGQCRISAASYVEAGIALDAYRRFGKGRHAAGLNYGDCFAYALAVSTGEELLYKGTDFAATDLAD